MRWSAMLHVMLQHSHGASTSTPCPSALISLHPRCQTTGMRPACRVPLDVAELACMEFGRTAERELGAKGGPHLISLMLL